jgi:hypothetical protein
MAGVVVAHDHGGGVVGDRAAHHLARMDLGAVDGAAEQFLERDGAMARVQEQHREHFVRAPAQPLREIGPGGLWVGQHRSAFKLRAEQAMAQFQRGRQEAGACRAQAGQLRQVCGRAFQQGPQRPVGLQQFARGGDGVAAAQARAQEDREQFGVGKCGGALREQALARALGSRPFADVHVGTRDQG